MRKMAIYMSVLLAVFMASEGVAQACGVNSGTSSAKTNFGPGNKHAK